MSRKLIIIGNGLGMAISPSHFDLTKAMARVWDKLDQSDKKILGSLKGIDAQNGPRSEEELISTQSALAYLNNFRQTLGAEALDTWFTKDATKYPDILNKFIFKVADELFKYSQGDADASNFSRFRSDLERFLRRTKSHVATLNYDDLIYDHLVTTLTKNKDRPAVFCDGFKFDSGSNVGKYKPDIFVSYPHKIHYLHLHGSPLFATRDNEAVKVKRSSRDYSDISLPRHIVLANKVDKEKIIQRSEILKDYWENRLQHCIRAADEIILFGYSGEDDHLNEAIRKEFPEGKKISVVEWSRAKHFKSSAKSTEISPTDYWREAMGRKIHICRLPNILDFTDWDDPSNYIPF
jgi:hypothetical protein